MKSVTFREWEEYGLGLWSNGSDTQHLSVIRWSGEAGLPPTGSYVVSINQASPSEPAVVSAKWGKRFGAEERPVPLKEAINVADLEQLIGRFRTLRGTPTNVRIVEQAI